MQALLKDAAESEHERHGLQGLVAELRRTLSTSEGKNCDLEEAVDLLGQEIISWKAKEEVWVEQKMEAEQAQYRAEGRATGGRGGGGVWGAGPGGGSARRWG